MVLCGDGFYRSDKGKLFVVTEKGKSGCINFRQREIGEPISEYPTEACAWMVQDGYAAEADDPDWITKVGYEVVYNYGSSVLHVGNPVVFPEYILAERYLKNHQACEWLEHELYIRKAVYEGKKLEECRTYQGQQVFNRSWYFGTGSLLIGDYVEEEIVDDIINCLPPVCMQKSCVQLGEPYSHELDTKRGTYRATYPTFKCVGERVWEYCGACFRGENKTA